MEPIQDFAGLICRLRSLKERKRVVVVCPNDPHTEYVITRSLHEGFADFLLVADTPHLLNSEYIRLQYPDHVKVYEATSPDKAAQEAVSLVREGHADVLMKGIINTDNLLRAVLNKEHGILPKGNVLSHITVAQIPMYKKLLFFSDAAVIPRPTLEQFEAMLRYDLEVCRRMGIEAPRVALIHCTEKVNEKFPHTLDYVTLKERAAAGAYGNMYLDGPMDVKTACDAHSGEVKGISSPVVGHADLLIFPNIEKMYSCGPTVYNYFHVGNARPFIIFDLLRRYFEYRGYKVEFVQNFTDIDDKVINKANEEGVDFNTIAERYIKEYFVDAQGLGVKKATVHPRATETIPTTTPMISAKMKPRIVSPPKKKMASSVTSVVPEVLIVRDSVELMALFTVSFRLRFG